MQSASPTGCSSDVAVPPQQQQKQQHNTDNNKSALQDNLDRKGKNAYYFAHAHKATGPAWDGKEQPKLLSSTKQGTTTADTTTTSRTTTSSTIAATAKNPTGSFDMSNSTITTYAFLDDGRKVKLYVTLEHLDRILHDDDDDDDAIQLEWTTRSLSLIVRNYYDSTTTTTTTTTGNRDATLRIARLAGDITKASVKRTPKQRLIVTLEKAPIVRTTTTATEDDEDIDSGAAPEYATWHTINDKGSPDHEVV